MNMVAAPLILRLLREAPNGTFDDIMLAHGWNLLCTDGSDVIAECQQRGIEIHNAGVYASGLLVGGDTCKQTQKRLRLTVDGPTPTNEQSRTDLHRKTTRPLASPSSLPTSCHNAATGIRT